MLKGGIKNIKKEYIYNNKKKVLYIAIGQFHERLENLWKLYNGLIMYSVFSALKSETNFC
jgi:hypothetical protein